MSGLEQGERRSQRGGLHESEIHGHLAGGEFPSEDTRFTVERIYWYFDGLFHFVSYKKSRADNLWYGGFCHTFPAEWLERIGSVANQHFDY